MTLSRSNPRAKGRWLFLGALTTILLLSVAALALAVHDEVFQLDGNIATTPDGSVGGGSQPTDWQDLFDANGNELGLPTDFTASGFDRDFNTNTNGSFNTSDNTTFATGSKDTLPITPGWQCNTDNNVLSKNDVMNSYAASYEDPATGDEILYFALERNANTGTANVAFWFLQDENVNCTSTGGSTAFTGDHVDGDLLAVSEFSQGGVVSTIQVYRWDGGANGSLNPNPVAAGVDCLSTAGNDTVCGTVNRATINNIPWLTANKQDGVGHSLRVSEFFEGGINLTDSGLGGRCFNVFMADTRSSTSLTATLFDFSRGALGQCTSTTVTTPADADGDALGSAVDIPATGTLEVKDSALITVTGVDTFDADVTFFLCGPDELTSASDVCDTGGVQIGDPVAVTANGTYLSDSAFLTSAGLYCWRAEFSGDETSGVPASSDSSAGECFVVDPLQPTIVTQATTGPVDFGETITDVVTLDGTADQEGTDGDAPEPSINATRGAAAGGTIHVDVYGPDSCDAADIVHSADLTVAGDGNYGGVGSDLEFEPAAPGEYVFVASYDGDDPNTLGVDAIACADQPAEERVTVRQIPSEIKTKQSWYPNDTATISASAGNLAADGTVTFELFDNATCEGDPVYSEVETLLGGAATEVVGTANTEYEITTAYTDAADSTVGQHSWLVTYEPHADDTAHTGIQSDCAEFFDIEYTNDAGPGTDLP